MRGKASAWAYREIAIELLRVGSPLKRSDIAALVDADADIQDQRRKARVKKGARKYELKNRNGLYNQSVGREGTA